jgi:hypothetical protein
MSALLPRCLQGRGREEPRLWSCPPAAAMESYIRDTTRTLEPSLASPQGGPEEKYYCALGYGRDVNGMGTRDWYLMRYSSSSLTGGQKHTHTFPPLKGKPTDDDLVAIRETLLPLLMVITYDQLLGVHSLTAILAEAAKYEADHGSAKFVRPSCLLLYDKNIADNATTVVRVRAKAAHKSCLDDYASYEAAERGVAKFLRDVVNEIWYNNLKDAKTFYTKSRPWRSWPISTPTVGGCMPLT